VATRFGGRASDQVRPVTIVYDPFGYHDASALISFGGTLILVAVSLIKGVPPFLRGKGTGWLTAEYDMLPTSTDQRTMRGAVTGKRNARSIEISRLIGRSLRSVANLELIGERTIQIDCDVLQADGGTRTAAISGVSAILEKATQRWVERGLTPRGVITDQLVAVSVGLCEDQLLLDLDQSEDQAAEADFNFVLTRDGNIVEIQGTSEKTPLVWEQFEKMRLLALKGAKEITRAIEAPESSAKIGSWPTSVSRSIVPATSAAQKKKPGFRQDKTLFSLNNRLER
jgi:ribonuclease PH